MAAREEHKDKTELEHGYVFWVLMKSNQQLRDDYESGIKPIAKFSTVNSIK